MTSPTYPKLTMKKSELLELFVNLCRIDSPSGEEKSVGDYVIEHFARHKIRAGRDAYGNVIAKVAGQGKPLVLSAHLDTVEPGRGVTPGVGKTGELEKPGIPAALVTAYLNRHGIQVEKTTDFTVLFLFSFGITKGKWGTLVTALLDFKRDYDNNTPLEQAIPKLTASHPERYAATGLRDLADEMFDQLKSAKQTRWLAEAFSTLPKARMTPAAAYRELVLGKIEQVELEDIANRVLATGVVPYPPGIPMLMPGESAGPDNGPYLSYLRALRSWDARFPGFGHDTHGVEEKDGRYYVQCLRQDAVAPFL
jgi:arginine decarboxylase